jgi:nitrogen fixation protein NifB
MAKDTTKHPCFNKASSGDCGRVHLPVAPKCNIQCNYCNRKYDCVNESRPGVTSSVLGPAQAVLYMEQVLEKEPRITVAGIAGPGDPFANPSQTLTTLRLLKERYPDLLFCLSSNGLGVPDHLDEIAEVGVTHMTITINAIDPEIGQKIYSWVRDGKVLYQGRDAAALLLSRQLAAVKGLKERGITVKVNTIIIPGVNEDHIPEIAKLMTELGVDIQNLIPICPTAETPFENVAEPSKERVRELRAEVGEIIPQMTHCRRCRADAVGLLCKDRSTELAPTLRSCAQSDVPNHKGRPFVAVCTREGMLINQHLGEATSFQIWKQEGEDFVLAEERKAPRQGCGPKRWKELGELLSDCRAVLAEAIGETPKKELTQSGTTPHVCTGFIRDALEAIYSGGDMNRFKGRKGGVVKACCGGGGGEGCG